MIVFNSENPNAKVLGNAILSVVNSIQSKFLLKKYLEKHQLANIDPENLYPQQHYLNLLKDLHEEMPSLLMEVGTHVFLNAKFPPFIRSLDDAYQSLNDAYHINNQNDESSSIQFEKQADRSYLITFQTPYPCPFNMGIIQGIGLSFQKNVYINHNVPQCQMDSFPRCAYHVSLN